MFDARSEMKSVEAGTVDAHEEARVGFLMDQHILYWAVRGG